MHDLQVCHLQERVKQKAPSPYCNGAKPLGPAPLTLRQTLRAHAARVTAAHGRWLLSEDDAGRAPRPRRLFARSWESGILVQRQMPLSRA